MTSGPRRIAAESGLARPAVATAVVRPGAKSAAVRVLCPGITRQPEVGMFLRHVVA